MSRKPLYAQNHPELREGEEFLGNVSISEYDSSLLVTKRYGYTAYDINGNVIDGIYPMFAKKEEMEYNSRYHELLGTPNQIPKYRDLHPELVTYKAGGFYKGEFDTYLKPDKIKTGKIFLKKKLELESSDA